MEISRNGPCPCGSGEKLKRCCLRVLEGAPAKTPVDLLRARYVAYGIGEVGFLIATTDPLGPHWERDAAAWEAELRAYCRVLRLAGLTVLSSSVDGDAGAVSYRADLVLQGRPTVLREDARYRRVGGRWLYADGDVLR